MLSYNLWIGALSLVALVLVWIEGGRLSRKRKHGLRLFVNPRRGDVVAWAVMAGRQRQSAGKTLGFPSEIIALQESLGIHPSNVFVEVGYRTLEMRITCRRFGWRDVKGIRGLDLMTQPAIAAEIEEATKGL